MRPDDETVNLAPERSKTRADATPRRNMFGQFLAIAVLAAIPPLFFGNYWLFIAAQVLAFAVAILGLDILYGRTGQLSLAHGAFMGTGAYTTVILAERGFGIGLQLLGVTVVALLAGLLVAVPTLRLSGLRLALVTLAFGELFAWVLTHTTDLTGGTQGAAVPPLAIGTLTTANPSNAYLMALVPAAMATLFAMHLGHTQLGRRMLAVRDSELAAESVGIRVTQTKIIAFLISAVLAGVAGWMYAGIVGFVAPPDFDLFASVFLFVAVVIGGAGSVWGAWLGAAYLVLVPQLFSLMGYPNLYAIVAGGLLAVVALSAPDGVAGLLKSAGSKARRLGSTREAN